MTMQRPFRFGVINEHMQEMPSMLIGSVDQIAAELLARRERYGFSYFVVSDETMKAFAPIVVRLTNQ